MDDMNNNPAAGGAAAAEEEVPQSWSNTRPRRVDDEVVAYLQSVSGALESAQGEEDEDDNSNVLVTNVLEELKQKEASVAVHKRASVILEGMLRLASAAQLTIVLQNFKNYFGFLCYDRFASHVVETLLRRAVALLVAAHAASDISLDIMGLREVVEELSSFLRSTDEWWNLAHDPAGTHILRTLVRGLAGQITPPRSATGGKRVREWESNPVRAARAIGPNERRAEIVKTEPLFKNELTGFLSNIQQLSADDLRDCACGTHASPFLQLLLRNVDSMESKWRKVVLKLLPAPGTNTDDTADTSAVVEGDAAGAAVEGEKEKEQEEEEGTKEADETLAEVDVASDSFISLAENPIGSHVLEVILTSAGKKDFTRLFNWHVVGSLTQLWTHPIANFVAQHCISAVRNDKQLDAVLAKMDEDAIAQILELGYVGVLSRAAQTIERFPETQKRFCMTLTRGCKKWVAAQKSAKEAAAAARGEEEKEEGKKKKSKKSSKKHKEEVMGTVEALLRFVTIKAQADPVATPTDTTDAVVEDETPKVQVGTGGVPYVHAPAAHLIGSLLNLSPKNNRSIVESVLTLPIEKFSELCRNPVGGRQVVETLLEAPVEFSWAKQRLVMKLRPIVIELAENKFAHHIVRKSFDVAPLREKRAMVKLVGQSANRLNGSAFGSAIVKHVKAEQFARHPDAWALGMQHTNKRRKLQQWANQL